MRVIALEDGCSRGIALQYEHGHTRRRGGSPLAVTKGGYLNDPAIRMIGREQELLRIGRWLDGSAGRALLLEGEAGIGKTTLLRAGVELAGAQGYSPLRTAPGEVDVRVTFAALADLLAPILDRVLPQIGRARRRAIEGALLLGDELDARIDERAVGFAVLEALTVASNETPLLLALDDSQWIDPSSGVVLAYVARRVVAMDSIRILLSRRPVSVDQSDRLVTALAPDHLERIGLGPLSAGAMYRIVSTRLGHPVARPTFTRLHDASGGNPFSAIEMARAVDAAGGSVSEVASRWGDQTLLHDRLAPLPAPTRAALLAVACTPSPDRATIEAVVGSGAAAVLEPAVAAGIITIDADRIRFVHPLLVPAIFGTATGSQQRAMHGALAAAAGNLETRALHLAHAADGPDPELAAALEDAGRVAEARGASAAAAELYELAVGATHDDDPEQRARRLIKCGRACFRAGDSGRARGLLERAAAIDSSQRHHAAWQLGIVVDGIVGGQAGLPYFAQALETDDDELASAVHRHLAVTLMHTGQIPEGIVHADAAVAAGRRSGDDRAQAYALGFQALLRFCSGRDGWRESLDEGLRLERPGPAGEVEFGPTALAADIGRLSFDLDAASAGYERLLDVAERHGDTRSETWALRGLALLDLQLCRLDRAEARIRSLTEISDQSGLMHLPTLQCVAQLAALRGDVDAARAAVTAAVRTAEERGEAHALRSVLAISGAFELSLGNPAAAVPLLARTRELSAALGVGEPCMLLPFVDEVEALVEVGDLDTASDVLDRFAAAGAGARRPWLEQTVARLRGVLAAAAGDLAGGIALLEAATAAEHDMPLPLHRARTWLALGRARRRAKQRGSARDALELARSRFAELGTPHWQARAEAERARTGGRERVAGLTPTELRVATLVARGATNKEAAAQLFVTPSAIEAALSRIYRKLGVRSRTELAGQSVGGSRLSERQDTT